MILSKNHSISRSLTISLLLTVVIIASIVITIDYYNIYRSGKKQWQDKVSHSINFLSDTLGTAIWSMDDKSIINIGNSYVQNDFVVGLVITDDANKVLYDFVKKQEYDVITKSVYIRHEEEIIGHARAMLTPRHYKAISQYSLWIGIFTTLGIIAALVIVTGLFLRKFLNKPLDLLIQGSERIAQGDYEYRFEDLKYVEIKSLASKFSYMSTQIEEREKLLEYEIVERKQAQAELWK